MRPERYFSAKKKATGTITWSKVKQTAQPCLYLGRLKSMNFAVPPLEEQSRIVSKVDELMKLCDELEQHLKTKEETGNRLAEAVVAAA